MTTLRHHNWWNFYQRGLDEVAAGNAERARKDFERCLGLRSGATYSFPKDLWRARTYGLHFQEQYFPHRELGVCYYVLGNDTQAIRWLSASLAQTPSGRAKHYLNLARKRHIEGGRTTTPSVKLDAASRVVWTRDRSRTISGTAAGEGYVSDIVINGRPQFIELASTNMPFSRTVTLQEGSNEIRIAVSDLGGHHTMTSQTWMADWRPPALLILRASKRGSEWLLEGRCNDDRRLARVTVRNAATTATLLDEKNPGSTLPLSLRFRDGESLMFDAVDTAGNTFTTELSASLFAPVVSAAAMLRYAAADAGGIADVPASSGGSKPPDDQAPEIRLGVPDTVCVFNEELILEGSVADANGLDSVRIRDEETLDQGDRGAVTYSLARRIPLNVGTNTIVVSARDSQGHVARRTVIAIRKVPAYLDRHYRMSLVMPPFLCNREGTGDLGPSIRRRAELELTRDPARFFLVERAEGWDLILREQRLAVSDLADPRALLQLGKVLPAELFLVGSVIPLGAGTTIYAVIADAETGETLALDDVYSEALDRELETKVAGLIVKLEQRFPLVEGKVTGIRRSRAVINVGSQHGVLNGARFLVIRPASDTAPMEDGDLCTLDKSLVQLRVKDVDDSAGTADIRPVEGRDLVHVGDFIYAR
ncbi:MAG: hypothetical protein V1929_06150 [bacterium]